MEISESIHAEDVSGVIIQKFVNSKKRDDHELSGEELKNGEELSFYREQSNAVPIMIYGASGTGKSKTIREVYSAQNCNCIYIDCASFDGSHKNAKEDLEGKYKSAQKDSGEKKKSCLVLNDVDLLDRKTQILLLDKLNSSNKSSFQVPQIICTTKCPRDELKEKLLPELFALLCQREITFQGLKTGDEIWKAFGKLWEEKKFPQYESLKDAGENNNQIKKCNEQLRIWLTDENRLFSGNWWDLNRYAIQYNDFLCGQFPGRDSDGKGKKSSMATGH